MITYNDLYEALRKERYAEQLQFLRKNFFKEVAEYLKEKESYTKKDTDLFSDIALKNKKKLENAIAIFKELLLRRKKKILNLAFVASEAGISKKDFENLAGFERELFEEIVNSLKNANKSIQNLKQGKQEKKFRLVRFLEDVAEFVDLNGDPLGPFEKGEVANLEKEIVDILGQDKRIEIIDED